MNSPLNKIIQGSLFRFNTLGAAQGFAGRAIKTMTIVLGDGSSDARYWVVTPADASRLVRAGFELA